ncbi:sulfite exporter TauE/SafE family protein [candidate division KSB1 bacterium]|nr:sulfite exporter TauE/SafE family protein [candidate division KSB1 bacterium]
MQLWLVYALTGLAVGFTSGLLGVGGGILMVPIFIYLLKLPTHVAIGTSLAVIIFTSIVGSIKHYQAHNVDLKLVIAVAIFSMIGSYFGASVCEKVPADILRKIFAVLLLATAVQLFFK